nr:serine protease inhibitor 3/4-like [Drosophila takahashii]
MFLSNGFPILPSFQKLSKNYFSTEAESTDLSAQGANKVNQWISKTTKGRIDDLIDPSMLDDGAKVILANAVSFEAFLRLNSVESTFYLPDEKRSVKVKMIDIVGEFPYRFQSALDSHIVTLPYEGSSLSLAIIVPRTFRGIGNLEDNLEHLDLDEMSLRRVHITLPKFKIKYEQDMAQPLIDLGLKSIFNHANLSDLTKAKETLRVDSIAHLVSIQVTEIGATGSAATDTEVARTRRRAVQMPCNRPFLFAIVEDTKILFFGRLSRPEWN